MVQFFEAPVRWMIAIRLAIVEGYKAGNFRPGLIATLARISRSSLSQKLRNVGLVLRWWSTAAARCCSPE
jgi:hypothetical protein